MQARLLPPCGLAINNRSWARQQHVSPPHASKNVSTHTFSRPALLQV